MKIKTIKAILQSEFNHFAESIKDKTVREMVEKNTIITGGSIVSMLLGEEVNDYDLYFRNKETALAVARHYVKESDEVKIESDPRVKIVIQSSGVAGADVEDDEDFGPLGKKPDDKSGEKYTVRFVTANAITLSGRVQLILRFYGEPDEIHKNYDYVHCTNYWTSWDGKLTLRQEALESIVTKELKYMGSLYPICSVIRSRKFINRSWSINGGQYLKMCWQISKLDLTDIKVLEDQLIGVDAAYFGQLIAALQNVDLKQVDASYVSTIIDRIF